MGLYIFGLVAISQWKCSNLVYLTVLPFLSVFRCNAAHSSDLGMIIIGLRNSSCSPADEVEHMYTNTPTTAHMNEGASAYYSLILHLVSSAGKDDWSLIRNIKECASCPHPVFTCTAQGIGYATFEIEYFWFLCSWQERKFRLKMFFGRLNLLLPPKNMSPPHQNCNKTHNIND